MLCGRRLGTLNCNKNGGGGRTGYPTNLMDLRDAKKTCWKWKPFDCSITINVYGLCATSKPKKNKVAYNPARSRGLII